MNCSPFPILPLCTFAVNARLFAFPNHIEATLSQDNRAEPIGKFLKVGDAIKRLSLTLSVLLAALFGCIGFFQWVLPSDYTANRGETFALSQPYLTAEPEQGAIETVSSSNRQPLDYTIKLFGMFPVKTVSVSPVDSVDLVPSGIPFGVKMFTQGAMIVGFEQIVTASGNASPGKEAGLRIGDLLQKVNGKTVSRNEEVAFLLQSQGSAASVLEVLRGEELLKITLTPVLSINGGYKSGVWIRDSAAGIGTLTFIDPETKTFAGLGHAICDVDTGDILSVGSGEICNVTIHSIHKGRAGIPGELQGVFDGTPSIGTIEQNNETGVYGKLFPNTTETSVPLARQQEISVGSAVALCTLDGEQMEAYNIEICSIDYNSEAKTQNMVIEVTDPRLLSRTGGIVQGMSGTPILQNGKLIGAVTHVFVNDPTKGYAIFAENMYQEAAGIVHQRDEAA